MSASTTDGAVTAAARGTYASFIGSGFVIANWAARIPQVRDHFHLTPAALGFVLLAIAAGSVLAVPLSGVVIHRFTSRRTVMATVLLGSAAVLVVAGGYLIGLIPVVIGLFLFGLAIGGWDPAQNVQAAAVERRLGRSIMPRFHAAFSVGTVAGAALGVGVVALHVPVPLHLLLVALLLGFLVPMQARHFLPDSDEEESGQESGTVSRTGGAFRRWLEMRTLIIGVFVLAFAFTEGAGNDWIGVALIDGYHAPAVLGTLAFTAFLTGMTSARWFGASLLDRYGRVHTVRGLAGVGLLGLLLFVFGHILPLAFLGAFLWGIGASLGFPSGMSAAADEPAAAPGRVSVVASIGYLAFLGGPPFVGFLGNQLTVLRALTAVGVVLALSMLLAGALQPLPAQSDESPATRQVPRGT